ncbi:MAG: hypothetical protein JW997_00845 [Actinobacteria bacterium]|nr:hypothetical protein [Actinomycetota bacterium]
MNLRKYTKYISVLLIFIVMLYFLLSASTGCSSIEDFKNGIISRINKSDIEKAAVATVEDFFNCIIEKDFAGAYSYIYIKKTDTGQQDDKSAMQNSNQYRQENVTGQDVDDFIDEFKDVTAIVKIETKWIEVKNNIAIVGIDLIDTYDGEEKIYKDIEISLIKDAEDNWKINFWK